MNAFLVAGIGVLTAASLTHGAISFVSQDRFIRASGDGPVQPSMSAPDFGPFSGTVTMPPSTYQASAQASQTSSLGTIIASEMSCSGTDGLQGIFGLGRSFLEVVFSVDVQTPFAIVAPYQVIATDSGQTRSVVRAKLERLDGTSLFDFSRSPTLSLPSFSGVFQSAGTLDPGTYRYLTEVQAGVVLIGSTGSTQSATMNANLYIPTPATGGAALLGIVLFRRDRRRGRCSQP